jgi:hypothetical protein
MIKQAISIHLTTTMLLSGAFYVFGTPQQALSCCLASVIVGANLGIIAWCLGKIFQKKSIALAVTVIVIKYAVLLGLFVYLYKSGWQVDAGFITGLSSLFPTVGYVALKYIKSSEINGSF